MRSAHFIAAAALVMLAAFAGCGDKGPGAPSDIEFYPCDSMDNVVSTDLVAFDQGFSSDGKGSLKVTVEQPATVPLFEVPAPGA
jgi:predicted small lipoprotein YifL